METLINPNQIAGGGSSGTLNVLNAYLHGDLTREGNIFSGFSGSDYITIPKYDRVMNGTLNIQDLNKSRAGVANADSWEIVVKVKFDSDVSSKYTAIFGQDSGNYNTPQLEIDDTNNYTLTLLVCFGSSQWTVVGRSFTPQADTWYWIKSSFTGTQYKLDISTDGINYSNIGSVDNSNKIYAWDIMRFGSETTSSADGYIKSLDLEETYIKINGEYWWQPLQIMNFNSMNLYI